MPLVRVYVSHARGLSWFDYTNARVVETAIDSRLVLNVLDADDHLPRALWRDYAGYEVDPPDEANGETAPVTSDDEDDDSLAWLPLLLVGSDS